MLSPELAICRLIKMPILTSRTCLFFMVEIRWLWLGISKFKKYHCHCSSQCHQGFLVCQISFPFLFNFSAAVDLVWVFSGSMAPFTPDFPSPFSGGGVTALLPPLSQGWAQRPLLYKRSPGDLTYLTPSVTIHIHPTPQCVSPTWTSLLNWGEYIYSMVGCFIANSAWSKQCIFPSLLPPPPQSQPALLLGFLTLVNGFL